MHPNCGVVYLKGNLHMSPDFASIQHIIEETCRDTGHSLALLAQYKESTCFQSERPQVEIPARYSG